MTHTTMTSREFNQNPSKAKRAATKGPVYVTDRGKPAHVLLSFEQFSSLTTPAKSLANLLAGSDECVAIEFETHRSADLGQPAELG